MEGTVNSPINWFNLLTNFINSSFFYGCGNLINCITAKFERISHNT